MKTPLYALALLLITAPAQAGIIFHQDFEDGTEPTDPDEGFFSDGANSCCDWSVQNVTSPTPHEGQHALLTTCRAGDPPVNGHDHRANLTTEPGGSIAGVEILPYDTDRWFGFAVYIAPDTAEEVANTNIFNTHAQNWGAPECSNPSGGTTPLSMRFIGPNYRWSGPGMTLHPEPYYWAFRSKPAGQNGSDSNDFFLWIPADGDVGRWVYFVFHIRHSYTPDAGFMQIWRDGESIYRNEDWDMSLCPIPQSCGNTYPKIGAGASTIEADNGDGLPFDVLYDSIRWGDENSSYEEVDPSQDLPGSGGQGGGDLVGGSGGAGAGVMTGGSAAVGGHGAAAGDSAQPAAPPECDDGGCAVTGRGAGGGLVPFGLLALAALLARRRRR